MCGRFTHYRTRDEYLNELTGHRDQDIIYDPESIARYNVATGTRALLLNQREKKLHLDLFTEAMHQDGGINSRS